MDDDPLDDPSLGPEQQTRVERLSSVELRKIDEALIGNTATSWRKVTRVIGVTMAGLKAEFEGIPDVFYAQRIKTLVKRGAIQSRGSLDRMRYSEIRKTEKSSA